MCHTITEVNDMTDKEKKEKDKTETDNRWVSTGIARPADEKDRRDGPGGENSK